MASIIAGPPDDRPPATKRQVEIQQWRRLRDAYNRAELELEQANHAVKKAQSDHQRLVEELSAANNATTKGLSLADRDELDVRRKRAGASEALARSLVQSTAKQRESKQQIADNYRKQLHDFAVQRLVTPSADKFLPQLAAASGIIAGLTGASVALAGSLARVVGLTSVLKFAMLFGFVGILAGLSFHAPPLYSHYLDFRHLKEFQATDDVAEISRSEAVQKFQFVTIGIQFSIWLAVSAILVWLVATV